MLTSIHDAWFYIGIVFCEDVKVITLSSEEKKKEREKKNSNESNSNEEKLNTS